MKIVLRVFIVLSLGLIASCGDDELNAVIRGMNPNQFSLGQINAVGSITGSDLSATAVSLGDGITVVSFTVKSSSEIEVVFNVSNGAAPGPRAITLTTTNGTVSANGAFNVSANKVPSAQFSISPSAGSVNTIFEFHAGNSSDPDDDSLSYAWRLSDGTNASGRKLNHKFREVGNYDVELKVTDASGGSDVLSRAVEVLKNSPPIVDIKVRPGLKGDTNTLFVLDGKGSRDPDGRITDYIWDLGDGTRKRRGAEIEYQYEEQGNFTVSLTAVDNKGNLATDQRELEVEKATSKVCAGNGSGHPAILRGKVLAIEPGNWAVVNFGRGASCKSHWHKCDDFRKWGADGLQEFFGIAAKMVDRGNGILAVQNACPLKWPPAVGEDVFLYFKTCQQNHCPGRPGTP